MDRDAGGDLVTRDLKTYEPLFNSRAVMGSPNKQERAFVKNYLQSGNIVEAYNAAGYRNVRHTAMSNQYMRARKVAIKPHVQLLLRIAFREWMEERKIDATSLCNEALACYDRADNVRDQLNALKFIAKLAKL